MNRIIKNKIIATLLLTIMLISNIIQIFPLIQSLAVNVNDTIYLQSMGTVPYHLKSKRLGYVITELAGYSDNGKFYPAYCLDKDLHGVDSNAGYNVTLTDLIKDTEMYNRVWRVTVASYPYHTPENLDWVYAYQATKMAIYCVTGQSNVNDFYADDGDTIGKSIVNLINELVNIGMNGTNTYKTPLAQINTNGDTKLNGNYYVQNYNLNSNLDLSTYSISIANFPNGTIITDTKGNTKNTFSAGEQFQIKIPQEEFEIRDINGKIRADIETKEYAIFYGASYNSATQDYAVTADPVSLNSCSTNLAIKNNKSAIKVYKYNEDKSSRIAGVTFELLKDNKVIKTVTTDSNGIATFDKLYKGKYYVREKNTVKGYLLNDEMKEIQVGFDSTAEFDMTNKEPIGELTLTKTDSETGSSNRVDGTSHHGDATLNGTVYTLYANEDIYNVAKTIKYFSKDEQIGTYNFDCYGNAVVKITNTTTSAKLESNNNTLKGLPMGTYYVKETVVPTGYMQDTQKHIYTLKYKDMNTSIIKIENSLTNTVQKARFETIKMSSITNTTAPIVKGAEFTAILKKYVDYYGSFNEALKHLDEFAKDEYSVFKTENNGHGISGLLAYGTYVVNETYCPSDRINPVKEFSVTIDKNSNAPIEELIENDTPFTSYIKMVKKDKKTGKTVTFSNTTFSLYKLNEGTNQWERVSCKLGKQSINEWTTDESGIAYTETKLEAGTYKIEEIKVPKGFLQLDEECIFEITRSNNTLEYDKDMDAYIMVEVKNEQPTGTLKLNKKIDLREDVDKTMIKDIDFTKISFELVTDEKIIDYADGSAIYEKGAVVGKYNLKADGTLAVSNLPMGKYHLKELTTIDGAVLDETEYKVVFEQKDTVTKEYIVESNIENKTTVVEISKQDITGEKELAGAKLTVTDENNEIIDSWVSTNKTHKIEGLKVGKTYTLTEEIAPDEYVKATSIKFIVENTAEIQKVVMIDKQVTMSKEDVGGKEVEGAELKVVDKDGNIVDNWTSTKEVHKIKGLEEGESYTLYEDYAPDGFVISNQIEFTVTEDKETQKIDMIDKVVEIIKTDLVTGEEIEGAELQVVDEDGNVVDEWVSTKEPHKVTGLEENKSYKLIEKTAPYGYEIAKEIDFTVTEDKETQKIEMKDMPILKNVKVIKVDAETKQTIKDKFTFAIYEDPECTKLIKEVKSNKEDGTALFVELRFGTYYIKETKAPKDYELSNRVVKVEINDKGIFIDDVHAEEKDSTIEFTFENKKIEVPKTGDKSKIKIFASAILLSLLGIVYIIKNHKKNKQD